MTALMAIANAAKGRSLEDFDKARSEYGPQLTADLLIKHHIHIVYDQLLESNLVGSLVGRSPVVDTSTAHALHILLWSPPTYSSRSSSLTHVWRSLMWLS